MEEFLVLLKVGGKAQTGRNIVPPRAHLEFIGAKALSEFVERPCEVMSTEPQLRRCPAIKGLGLETLPKAACERVGIGDDSIAAALLDDLPSAVITGRVRAWSEMTDDSPWRQHEAGGFGLPANMVAPGVLASAVDLHLPVLLGSTTSSAEKA